MRKSIFISGIFGFLALIMGAIGEHFLRTEIAAYQMKWFEVALNYHHFHTLVLLALGIGANLLPENSKNVFKRPSIFIMLGIIMFSGGIYIAVFINSKYLNYIPVLGGMTLLTGWVFIARAGLVLKK
jgi:uncharacterized membrane protein YgdD (TMEM256/DUF423 family)